MAKEQFTPEEIEHIEGKEIPKEIHYLYLCNQRSTGEELLLFFEKLVILTIFLIVLSILAPQIIQLISDMWLNYANNVNNGVPY